MQENKEGHRWDLNTCIYCGMKRKMRNKPKTGQLIYSHDNFATYQTKVGPCFRQKTLDRFLHLID